MLTARVMLNHHDIRSSSAASEAALASDFLAVSTFLRPSFRISVGPRTGQLSVVVQAATMVPKIGESTAKARH